MTGLSAVLARGAPVARAAPHGRVLLDATGWSYSTATAGIEAYSLAATSAPQQPGLPATLSVIDTGGAAAPLVFAGELISGVDAATPVTVTLMALDGGVLTCPDEDQEVVGAVVSVLGTDTLVVTGSASQVNAALQALAQTSDEHRAAVAALVGMLRKPDRG